MPTSLPQVYLIILGSSLFILAIVIGRQAIKVRSNEANLSRLEKSGAINSNSAENLYELGSAQLKKRLYPQATNSLKQALKQIKEEPDDAKAIIENALGFSLAAQDNFKEAIKHYENAINSKKDYIVAMNNLAFAKQKVMKNDDAIEIYNQVLKIDPQNKTANKKVKQLNRLTPNISKNNDTNKGF